MSRRGEYLDAKIYIGGLPEDATTQELEDAFHRFGRIRKVWIARRPPGFAFIEFEDSRDAEDACKALDGTRICGVRARVEMSNGRKRGGQGGGSSGGRNGGFDRREPRRSISSKVELKNEWFRPAACYLVFEKKMTLKKVAEIFGVDKNRVYTEIIEAKVNADAHMSVESLKEAIETAFENLDEEIINRAVDN